MLKSPLRYPGGKTKFAPRLARLTGPTDVLIEPFVGGGSVFIHYLENKLITRPQSLNQPSVVINDKDETIAAFWRVVFSSEHELLIDIINTHPPSLELFYTLRASEPESLMDKAFYALFFNRTTFSGISTSGPIGGAAQGKYKVDCRYNAKKLSHTISELNRKYAKFVRVYNLDFEDFIKAVVNDDAYGKNTKKLIYADPPYYVKGDALYPVCMADTDHTRLRDVLSAVDANIVVSYDDHPFIRNLYTSSAFRILVTDMLYTISGTARSNQSARELLISRQ